MNSDSQQSIQGKLTTAWVTLMAGVLVGSSLIYGALFLVLESHEAAGIFTFPTVVFMVPVFVVFIAANHRANKCLGGTPPGAPGPNDKLLLAAYALCFVPVWFSSLSFWQGNYFWGCLLGLVWVVGAFPLLKAAYRIRLWVTYSELAKSG